MNFNNSSFIKTDKKYFYKLFLLLTIILFILIPIIQLHIKYLGYYGVGGVYINDTSSYWDNLISFSNENEINAKYFSILGVLLIYYPCLFLGSLYCFALNVFLLFLALKVFLLIILDLEISFNNSKITFFLLLVFSNFYLWGILYYPNKEIPLIFLTNLFIYTALKKRHIFNFLLLFVIFFF